MKLRGNRAKCSARSRAASPARIGSRLRLRRRLCVCALVILVTTLDLYLLQFCTTQDSGMACLNPSQGKTVRRLHPVPCRAGERAGWTLYGELRPFFPCFLSSFRFECKCVQGYRPSINSRLSLRGSPQGHGHNGVRRCDRAAMYGVMCVCFVSTFIDACAGHKHQPRGAGQSLIVLLLFSFLFLRLLCIALRHSWRSFIATIGSTAQARPGRARR